MTHEEKALQYFTNGANCAQAVVMAFHEELGIDENSVILCFSTEGDTDKKNYRDIVWDGKYPSFE